MSRKIPHIHMEVKSGKHKKNTPYPVHDFSILEKLNANQESGGALIAGNSRVLKDLIDTRHRFEPNAEEITYFYYECSLTEREAGDEPK